LDLRGLGGEFSFDKGLLLRLTRLVVHLFLAVVREFGLTGADLLLLRRLLLLELAHLGLPELRELLLAPQLLLALLPLPLDLH
jgi:hypothetical protein